MLPVQPKIPDEPVPLHLTGLIQVHDKAVFWARLATAASVVTAAAFLALALFGSVRWIVAVPFFLAPLIPISAETRVQEIRRIIDEQLRDQIAERSQGGTPPEHAPL